ncbi:MAG: restriction endonuclease subunit S [Bacteroidales bacterium]|nr:restriction endonuclease subunit S [Bacteroidales bacterium]
MEGLEISEVEYSMIEKENRYDSEYYMKRFLDVEYMLSSKKHFRIKDEFIVTDGEHGSVEYLDAGIKYLTAENIKNGFIDVSNVKYVSEDVDKRNKRASVEAQDVLISIKGTLGQVAIAEAWLKPCNMNRDVAIIKAKNNKIKNEYLAVFLMTRFGNVQSSRGGSGGVQQMITLERLRMFYVPHQTDEFYLKISEIYNTFLSNLSKSKSLYSEAEEILLSELGLKDWQPNNAPVNIKQLKESFLANGRLDAEYYQTKYDELFFRLSQFECDTIKDIANIKKSVEPGSEAYQESGIPFVRVSDVTKFGISEPNVFLSQNDYDLKELQPKKDTILLSKDGSVGIAYKVEEDTDCITSGALLHLSVFNKEYNSDYLTLVLNSIVVQMQAERDSNGAIIQHWKPSEIEQVIIPKLPKPIQETISARIQESFALKAESKRLLDEAKMMVEREIEKTN